VSENKQINIYFLYPSATSSHDQGERLSISRIQPAPPALTAATDTRHGSI